MENIPSDIIILIFEKLNSYDLLICSNVCKSWNNLIKSIKIKSELYEFKSYTSCLVLEQDLIPQWILKNNYLPTLWDVKYNKKNKLKYNNRFDKNKSIVSYLKLRHTGRKIPNDPRSYFIFMWGYNKKAIIDDLNFLNITTQAIDLLEQFPDIQNETDPELKKRKEATELWLFYRWNYRIDIRYLFLWKDFKKRIENRYFKTRYVIPYEYVNILKSNN